MRKTFKMEELDCANCAAKMENAIKSLEGVTFVSVSFLTQKLILEADDEKFDEIINEFIIDWLALLTPIPSVILTWNMEAKYRFQSCQLITRKTF